MKNTKDLIKEVLKKEDRMWFTDDEKKQTELNQTLLIELVEKTDENIINLLLQNKTLREKFFVKIKDVYVFKTRDFVFFLEENKIDNSFTDYKNRIGLTDGKRFLKDTTDVVLDFPYKDCVLEGGQSNEDGTDTFFEYDKTVTKAEEKKGLKSETYNKKQAKRKEVFFNSVLAQDEIDRLFDKKALINWKKFDKNGEQTPANISRDENGTIKDNLIIKGNNLLALHSLKSEFAGKVKLIYIDPPYNTGNDGFKYNDNFNHSTWLTFMKNRLEVAKNLLRDDGVIFVQCDHRENSYLRLLLNDIFGRGNFVNEICWKKYAGVKNQASNRLTTQHENVFIFSKTNLFIPYPVYNPLSEKYIKNEYKYKDENGRLYAKLRGRSYQNTEGGTKIKYLDENPGSPITTLWDEPNLQLNTSSSEKLKDFIGQKPEALIKRIIELSTQPNDIVLDYHLGSGTTCAVAHKMGRQYIGIEQMDYIEDIAVERVKKVIDGEQGGISKSVDWQGGGDFLYCELAEWNEKAKAEILQQKDFASLRSFFKELYEKYFLNYNLKTKEFVEQTIAEENFAKLTLDEQKAIFIAMLDNNQMYVNQSEIDDEKYGVSDSDKKMSGDFYNLKEK